MGVNKMLLNDEAPIARVGPRRATRALEPRTAPRDDTQREVESLRSFNAYLLREVAVLKEREAQMQLLADRDSLTGLYNRRRLQELLETAIAEAARQWQRVGLLFIDLNGFKGINDEYGHAAGDRVLTTAAKRIAARVRTADIVGRYGGDEFVVILPGVPDAAAVSRVAEIIRERMQLPYRVEGTERQLSASIGESLYPYDGKSAEALLKRADQAMYRLKAGRARAQQPAKRPSRRRNDEAKA
jgi:diguanylate cyclase (GGDEF)-like protein